MAEKPPIVLDQNSLSESLLDELLANLASLASVYHKSPALLGQGGSTHDFRFEYTKKADFFIFLVLVSKQNKKKRK